MKMLVIWRLKWMKKNSYVKGYIKRFSFLHLNQIIVFDYGSLCVFAHMFDFATETVASCNLTVFLEA